MHEFGLPEDGQPLAAAEIGRVASLVLQQMTVAAVSSSLLVLAIWVAAGRLCRIPKPSAQDSLLAWVIGPVLVLPALLLVNVAYTLAVRRIVGTAEWEIQVVRSLTGNLLFWILLTVQPAIFEEWFFRYLALGAVYDALRGSGRKVAMHLSVLLTAFMFAVAHIGQLVAVPYLLLMGVALGYLRLASGGLALPMLLHFLHNGAVLLLARSAL
jgi:membrane protease YdiL (CAAX protease family)